MLRKIEGVLSTNTKAISFVCTCCNAEWTGMEFDELRRNASLRNMMRLKIHFGVHHLQIQSAGRRIYTKHGAFSVSRGENRVLPQAFTKHPDTPGPR